MKPDLVAFLGQPFKSPAIDVAGQHSRPFFHKTLRAGSPDTGRRPCDNCYFPVEGHWTI